MVVYLKHEKTGLYIGVQNNAGQKSLVTVEKESAAPFFTSYSRFVSFDFPTYHMSGNKFVQIKGSIRDIALSFETKKEWSLSNCMIYNAASSKSFDVVSGKKAKNSGKKGKNFYLGSAAMDKTSPSQRFDVGLSGQWYLTSNKLGYALTSNKKN